MVALAPASTGNEFGCLWSYRPQEADVTRLLTPVGAFALVTETVEAMLARKSLAGFLLSQKPTPCPGYDDAREVNWLASTSMNT